MSEGKKPERRLIPVEIINRYSSVMGSRDIEQLRRTGYTEALVNSGFMDNYSILLVTMIEFTFKKKQVSQEHYNKYYEYAGRYEFPSEYAHSEWESVKERVAEEMTIEDVCLVAVPIVESLCNELREDLSEKIIACVLDEHRFPRLVSYPSGVIDEKDYADKKSVQEKGVISLIEFRYMCAARDCKVIETRIGKKINKSYGSRKTSRFVEIWENMLFKNQLEKAYKKSVIDSDAISSPPQPEPTPPPTKKTETQRRDEILNDAARELWLEGCRSLKDIAVKIEVIHQPGISDSHIRDIIRQTVKELKAGKTK